MTPAPIKLTDPWTRSPQQMAFVADCFVAAPEAWVQERGVCGERMEVIVLRRKIAANFRDICPDEDIARYLSLEPGVYIPTTFANYVSEAPVAVVQEVR